MKTALGIVVGDLVWSKVMVWGGRMDTRARISSPKLVHQVAKCWCFGGNTDGERDCDRQTVSRIQEFKTSKREEYKKPTSSSVNTAGSYAAGVSASESATISSDAKHLAEVFAAYTAPGLKNPSDAVHFQRLLEECGQGAMDVQNVMHYNLHNDYWADKIRTAKFFCDHYEDLFRTYKAHERKESARKQKETPADERFIDYMSGDSEGFIPPTSEKFELEELEEGETSR